MVNSMGVAAGRSSTGESELTAAGTWPRKTCLSAEKPTLESSRAALIKTHKLARTKKQGCFNDMMDDYERAAKPCQKSRLTILMLYDAPGRASSAGHLGGVQQFAGLAA
jgi:hypothetical protein